MVSRWMMRAPCLLRLSLSFCTLRSLPGTTDEESTTVSPFLILTYLCVFIATRMSAANSSPCAPVASITTLLSGRCSSCAASINVLSETLSIPSCFTISMLTFAPALYQDFASDALRLLYHAHQALEL